MGEYILMDSINNTYFTGNIIHDRRRIKPIYNWANDINEAKIYDNVEELKALVKKENFTDIKIIEDPFVKYNSEDEIKLEKINSWTEIINMKIISFIKYKIADDNQINYYIHKRYNLLEYILKNKSIINNILKNNITEYYYKEKLHMNNIYRIPEDLINIFEYELELGKNEAMKFVTKIFGSEFGINFDIDYYIIEKETINNLYENSIIFIDINNKNIIILDIKNIMK